jgi:hypothetical protein
MLTHTCSGLYRHRVMPTNVNSLLDTHGVPSDLDILSIDIGMCMHILYMDIHVYVGICMFTAEPAIRMFLVQTYVRKYICACTRM